MILTRHTYSPSGTFGIIRDGDSSLVTVERPWLDNETFISCIPEGEYLCKRYSSSKYPNTFEIKDVPGRTKILFHIANYPSDVQGCIGLGLELMDYTYGVSQSRLAMKAFMDYTKDMDTFELKICQYRPFDV